jgi:hypothetical protein
VVRRTALPCPALHAPGALATAALRPSPALAHCLAFVLTPHSIPQG